jgi:hypothetical protein
VEISKCLCPAECYISRRWSETFAVPLYMEECNTITTLNQNKSCIVELAIPEWGSRGNGDNPRRTTSLMVMNAIEMISHEAFYCCDSMYRNHLQWKFQKM